MKRMNSLLVKGFQPAKFKTQLRLGTSRIKLLRNKKGLQIAAARKEVAEFLRTGQEGNAQLRVEHVIREQNLVDAYDLLYLYAERIAGQLTVIDSQKTCPPELKEDISTLLFASSRCTELPDFAQLRPMFLAKYGKDFVSAAEEFRPGCAVNGRVVEKLSVSRPSGEAKLKLMKEIAAEHKVEWDPTHYEKEIREVPEHLLDGPTQFMTIDDLPTVPSQKPTLEIHLAQPGNITNSNSGKFMEDKVEPTNSPPPVDDFRTGSEGARSGPPSRRPPGREQSRTEDLSFDGRHTDMDPVGRETRRNSRRESDIFPAPLVHGRYQDEESRRKSIGVPGEKSGWAQTGSALPYEYTERNRKESQGAEVDDFDGSHRSDRRQSMKYDQYAGKGQMQEANAGASSYAKFSGPARTSQEWNHTSDEDEQGVLTRPGTDRGRRNQTRLNGVSREEGSGKSRTRKQDHDPDEGYYTRVPNREGSGKARAHYQDQEFDDHDLRRAPSKEGSGKARAHYQDQEFDDHDLRRAPSKEGSGKGRAHYQDQEFDDHDLRRAPSKEGSGKARAHYQDQEFDDHDLRRAPSKEGSGKARAHYQDQEFDDHDLRRAPSKEGSGKARAHYQDQEFDDHDLRRAPSKEGSGKARAHYQDQEFDDHDLRRAPSKEGSGKGRMHYEDQYAEEDNFRRASSKGGSGSKMHSHETSVEEGSHGRISGRGKEGKQYAGKNRRHDDSDEDISPRSEEPRGIKNTPKYVDEDDHNHDWDSELFRNSVTTRIPRNSEDEYRDFGKGTRRESLYTGVGGVSSLDDFSDPASVGVDDRRKTKGTFVDETLRKSDNPTVRQKDNRKSIPDTPHYDSSEYEDDPRGGGARKPESRRSNFKSNNTKNSDRSSESGEEGSRHSARRTSKLPSVDEVRREALDDKGSSRGKRPEREDLNSSKTSRNSGFDDDQVNFNDHFTTSSRTEMRMSLPGGSVGDKFNYQGNRASDDYDDTVRPSGRRATVGPAEIRAARFRDTEDSPRSRYVEDTRRQSAPLPKADITEGRQSPNHHQRDGSDRRRLSDIPAGYDDHKPTRFSKPVVQATRDDESSTRAQRDRADRQRKSDKLPEFDDKRPPPRFIKVGNQPTSGDGEKPQRFVNSPRNHEPSQPTPPPPSNLKTMKTVPELSGTPKLSAPEHRKSQSASDGQPQSRPQFRKPPDLDDLIQMFGKKK